MRTHVAACLLGGLLLVLVASTAHASALPPPPPPPGCLTCNPPPPPPTPVPTVAPTAVPAQPAVDVHLAAQKVSRGQTDQVSVDASTNDTVILLIQFKTGKPITFRSRIGGSGTLVQKFRVPKGAPVGKAVVKISVKGAGNYSGTISFLVTK
jgi:hypothetical protein